MKHSKNYVAEFFGTFCLVFIGCGSAVISGHEIGNLGISIAFGITVTAMIYSIGPISGCHINPAITISMVIGKKIKLRQGIFYIIFQCLGAIFGSGLLYLIATGSNNFSVELTGLGQNGFGSLSPDGYSLVSAFLAELIMSTIFIFVVHGATSRRSHQKFAGLAIGLTLMIIHILGIPITGVSVNPARSLGPAVFLTGKTLQQLWLFWVAPILGGILAFYIWTFISNPKKDKENN